VTVVPLREASDETAFGGKAVSLGACLRAGLPVPDGVALSVALVEAAAAGHGAAIAAVRAGFAEADRGRGVAARSSAVGEDGAEASFAGQHASVLGVRTADALLEAVAVVRASGRSAAAAAYRARLGVTGEARVAVVIQAMLDPESAGVMFTRDPVDGSDARVIEAAWGLGEAVVGGLVTPDRYRVLRGGRIVERVAGEKDVAVRRREGGGTEELPVPAELVHRLCLADDQLRALDELAVRCEQLAAGHHDIEWAVASGHVYLLQRRAVTR
jgi:pyruvate, water dikinase